MELLLDQEVTTLKRAAALLVAASVVIPGPARALPKDFVLERVARVTCPTRACITQMQFAPNGDLYLNVRTGTVRVIRDGKLVAAPVARVQTTTDAEGGLLGLALDPAFGDNGRLYIFRTTPDGQRDLVERVERDGSRETVLELSARGTGWHHGGALAFGPDGKLYVAHGESHDRSRAADPRALGGKIYRLNPDGSIPEDNPFDDEPTWSYGHRNPFGIAFDPESERMWETENGPEVNDELNLIERGKDHGWPDVMGRGGSGVQPKAVYETTIVPTNLAFANDSFPAPYRANLFFGAYKERAIHRIVLDDQRTGVARDEVFVEDMAAIGMTFGPDGMYFSTDDAVWRVRPRRAAASTAQPAPTATATQPPSTPGGSNAPLLGGLAAAAIAIAAFAFLRRRRG